MSSNYSAQGSISIRRLRNGDSLYLSFNSNGKPLYQGVDTSTGSVAPDWTVAANQPIITPKATTVRGNTVVRSSHQWKWNGQLLLFTGATSSDGNWRTDSTGKFQINLTSGDDGGALKIIGNLANANAVANGQLEYSCIATVSGANYDISKTIDVVIQNMGASSFIGYIVADTQTLDANTATSLLTTSLQSGATLLTSYYVKWYMDDTLWPAMNGNKQITVGRNDVNGTQLFIAEFYLQQTDTTPVARFGVSIIDSLDEFKIAFDYVGANREVAPGQDVTVKAKVINTRTNSVQALTNPVWKCDVMEKDTWTSIKHSTTDSITVTTTETDRNNKEDDVEVVAEVDFS